MRDVVYSMQVDNIILSDDDILNDPRYRNIQERVFNAKVHIDA